MTKYNKSDINVGAGNEIQRLRYNLLKASSWLTNETRKLLKPYGITPKQYSILRNLVNKSPESSSIQEVREGLADKMSDASRLIDRLVKKGYLDKFTSDYDRRSNRVRVSDSGLKILQEINTNKEALDRLVSDLLSEQELRDLNRLLGLLQ